MKPDSSARRPFRSIDPSQLRPQRKVFDIARPGRMPASSTSRPIAPSHQPAVHDSSVTMHGKNRMFGQQPPASQPTDAPTEFVPSQAVAPPQSTPVSVVGRTLTPPPPRPPSAPLRPTASPSSHPAMATPDVPPTPVAVQPLSSVSAPAAPVNAYPRPQPRVTGGQPIDDIPADIGPMHINEDPVLISKHIPKDENHKWRWIIIASVIFLFLLVIVDILLDADFITLRQVPHTHFF